MEPSKYQPYRKDQREGSNNFTANEGEGSTKPVELNGWSEWARQRKGQTDERTTNENT